MSTDSLMALIDGAAELADPDITGHRGRIWQMEGGRPCPIGWWDCSQAVYMDAKTGDYDYGERGGPSHADCQRHCPHDNEPPSGD